MDQYIKNGIIVGCLFLLVTFFSLLGSGLVEEVMFADDYLQTAHLHQNQWILGLIIHISSAVGAIFIAVMMFPMLKAQNISIAIGYLIFPRLRH